MERDDHEDIAVPTTRRKIPQAGAGSLLRVKLSVATVAVQLLMSGRRPAAQWRYADPPPEPTLASSSRKSLTQCVGRNWPELRLESRSRSVLPVAGMSERPFPKRRTSNPIRLGCLNMPSAVEPSSDAHPALLSGGAPVGVRE